MLPVINILNAGIWESAEGSKEKTLPRVTRGYEIEYCISSVESYIDDGHYVNQKGNIIFARPGQVRYSKLPLKVYFIYFDIESCDETFVNMLANIPTSSYIEMDELKSFEKIMRYNEKKDSDSILKMQIILLNLLYNLSSSATAQNPFEYKKQKYSGELIPVIRYMQENVYQKCSAEELASVSGYSLPHFNAVFRSVFHNSPINYFNILKINEAKRLLINTTLPVCEIAQSLQYSSINYFCSSFRLFVGKTPLEFRKTASFVYNTATNSEELIVDI